MPHDKIRAAARKRMADTGEPYTAARRAVISEHQAAGAGSPPPGAGYALRMSGEIHDWLAGLRRIGGRAAPGEGWPGARSGRTRLRRPAIIPGGVLPRHRR